MYGNVQSDPKVGNFDWITDFDDIECFLDSRFTGLDHSKKDEIRVLVSGCGTSVLSIQLADLGFGEIVSVDNDGECINHMKLLHGDDCRLKWITYDMVDPASTNNADLGTFNLIVDKGTLDAILVEGKYLFKGLCIERATFGGLSMLNIT
jgi:2-polyprenyl-3-methyl-5-hydroxy-6-metoxy-1,4-benzoquinol methylase